MNILKRLAACAFPVAILIVICALCNMRYGAETRGLSEPDVAKAYENVLTSQARLRVGSKFGMGTVWEVAPDRILIAANRHVLRDMETADGVYASFFDGASAPMTLVGLSDTADVAVARVDPTALPDETLFAIRAARAEQSAYEKLQNGDRMFFVHFDVYADLPDGAYAGTVADKAAAVEGMRDVALYCLCDADGGMSGSGVFDAYGNLIGMLSAGSENNETLSVPAPRMIDEIKAILKKKD